MGGARTSMCDGGKVYKMLAKSAGKVLYIHVHVVIYAAYTALDG